jgi:hypothetical protein
MDGSVSTRGSIAPLAAISIKPTVPRYSAAQHARDANDIHMLSVRVPDAKRLSDELIDWGCGYRNSARELECILRDLSSQLSPRECLEVQSNIDSFRGLEFSCRDELAALPSWADQAKCFSWPELAREAARRESIAA